MYLSPRPVRRPALPVRMKGLAMMEYCLICALVALVLFSNPNTPKLLADAVRAFYRSFTFFISLP